MKTIFLPLFLILFPAFCLSQGNKPVPAYKGSFLWKQMIIGQKLVSQINDPVEITLHGNTLHIYGIPVFELNAGTDSLPATSDDAGIVSTTGWTICLARDSCVFTSPGKDTLFKWTQPAYPDAAKSAGIIQENRVPTENKSTGKVRGDLLIVEIPPNFPDKMPVYKPDSSVHYFLKIVGTPPDKIKINKK